MLGFFKLSTTLLAPLAIADGTEVPGDPTLAPTFRVYGNGELMANGTGSLTKMDRGSITAAQNSIPIQVTSANHRLSAGTQVTVSGVLGNTAANGVFQVSPVDPNTFTLNGSSGNGNYLSGGEWHVTGLYQLSLPLNAGDGYLAGTVYTVYVTFTLGGTTYSLEETFLVV